MVVHRQEDMTRPPSSTGSVRRTSAAAASLGEVRRAAVMPLPPILALYPGPEQTLVPFDFAIA